MKIEIDGLNKRISSTEDFISINYDKCNNCERCIILCVMNLWRKRDGKIYLLDEYKLKCLECAACFQVCETGAISFKYPIGGTGIVFEQG